jgi:NADH-quinone oxidoreductase subunit F
MNNKTLEQRQAEYLNNEKSVIKRIIICAGTACIANGALKVYDEFVRVLTEKGVNAKVSLKDDKDGILLSGSGCQGFGQMGPLVTIYPENTIYCKVQASDVTEIVETTVLGNEPVTRLLYHQPGTGETFRSTDEIPFYKNQFRFVLKGCGHVDPADIDEYIAKGGYFAARNVLKNMSDEEICREMTASGLRGRGGGGFPTGIKWEAARKQPKSKKYIICNADEGDPGAFMDRSVMEGNPHCVIEGMIIAAKAVGADEGYVYIRAEYPLAVRRIRKAVQDARDAGILGKQHSRQRFQLRHSGYGRRGRIRMR